MVGGWVEGGWGGSRGGGSSPPPPVVLSFWRRGRCQRNFWSILTGAKGIFDWPKAEEDCLSARHLEQGGSTASPSVP